MPHQQTVNSSGRFVEGWSGERSEDPTCGMAHGSNTLGGAITTG